MANENVGKFEELLKGSEELQAKLKELAAEFEGDKTDAKAIFNATIGKLAEEAGLPFTFDEGAAYVGEDRNLSDEELDAVAGGGDSWGVCYIVGISNGPDFEGHLCAYLGATLC